MWPIALLFHDRGTRRGWVVSSTPRPHFTPRKEPVPILQEAGWAPGPVWTGGKSRPHWDLIPDRPAPSQSLYRLSSRPTLNSVRYIISKDIDKGKAVPLEARSGPKGSRKLRFPDFVITAQDGGKVSLTHRPPLPPGSAPGTYFC